MFDNDNIYLPFFTDLRPHIYVCVCVCVIVQRLISTWVGYVEVKTPHKLILDIKHRLLQQYTLGKFENSKEWIYYISVKLAIDMWIV